MSPEIRDMDNKDIQMISVIIICWVLSIHTMWMRFCFVEKSCDASVSLFKYKLASQFMRHRIQQQPMTIRLPEIYVSVFLCFGQFAGILFSLSKKIDRTLNWNT